ncbi:MAG: aminopeptidase, partial [Thermoleophilaceae bacterium]
MRDSRAEALAQILVRYSTRVSKGDVCVIQSTSAAEVLVQSVYEEVLRAGGLPVMQLTTEGAQSAFFDLAGEEQLDWIPPPAEWAAENSDVRIAVMADVNARELSHAYPAKQARSQKARKPIMETSMRRSAAGEHRWSLTLFPTHGY